VRGRKEGTTRFGRIQWDAVAGPEEECSGGSGAISVVVNVELKTKGVPESTRSNSKRTRPKEEKSRTTHAVIKPLRSPTVCARFIRAMNLGGGCLYLSETSRSRRDDERNKEIGEAMNGSLPLTEKISV
jgi:hypothetical protein